MTAFWSRYSVDAVPWYWWLPMQLYGWIVGTAMFMYFAFVSITSKIHYEGWPVDTGKNYIFCCWHQNLILYFCLVARFNNLSFMVHPAWYMIPSHKAAILQGTRHLVFGSSGNRGKRAASQLVEYLRQGDNTFLTPDGPYGPNKQVHKGALHVSLQSGAPLVGMSLKASRYFSLRGWDKKQIPLPFGRITVCCGEPFLPDKTALDEAATRLGTDMN
jgi:lysophospholipid acyltransferase (LPLAT)-like uncharacterized protein